MSENKINLSSEIVRCGDGRIINLIWVTEAKRVDEGNKIQIMFLGGTGITLTKADCGESNFKDLIYKLNCYTEKEREESAKRANQMNESIFKNRKIY